MIAGLHICIGILLANKHEEFLAVSLIVVLVDSFELIDFLFPFIFLFFQLSSGRFISVMTLHAADEKEKRKKKEHFFDYFDYFDYFGTAPGTG